MWITCGIVDNSQVWLQCDGCDGNVVLMTCSFAYNPHSLPLRQAVDCIAVEHRCQANAALPHSSYTAHSCSADAKRSDNNEMRII